MTKKEYIPRLQGNESKDWFCFCGNSGGKEGFYTCDKEGNELAPVNKEWKNLYACHRCGRIIKQNPPEVVGQRKRKLTDK
jgi:hypothetical protein